MTTAGASQAAPNPAFPFPLAFKLLGSDPSKITGFAALSSAWVFPSSFLHWQPGDLFFSSFISSYAGLSPLSEVDKFSPKVLAFMRRNLYIKLSGSSNFSVPSSRRDFDVSFGQEVSLPLLHQWHQPKPRH